MDFINGKFTKGVHNLLDSEIIPQEAMQDGYNWFTENGKTILVGGRINVGAEGTIGGMNGLFWGYKVDGSKVLYRKTLTKIQYLNGSTWTDVLTGLTNSEITFANYSSLAGAFTFINGVDGYWKIINANPANAIDVYDASKNFKGRILINTGRTVLWNRDKDKTGLYGSYIDKQNSTVYTAVTGEAVGVLGSATYSGTLAFKAGGSTRSCFAVVIKGNVVAGLETFTDNYLGVLTSNYGGTGTINYATGAYSVTFSAVTTGAVTSDYQWENSNAKGITDFTKSATRLAGEGFQFPQDEGGDAIENVLIGQDGAYYSLKSQSAYRLMIGDDDLTADNNVYRKDMGIPYWRCAISTPKGIVFLNTANPTNPQLTILVRNQVGNEVEPVQLVSHFKFNNYIYDRSWIDTFDKYILLGCKSKDSTFNDTILLINIADKTVDILGYSANMMVKNADTVYVGSSITQSVYQIFSGYDDMGLSIDNFVTTKDENYGSDILKKFKKLRISGDIDPNQYFEVYANYDNAGRELVGTIRGSGSYVDYTNSSPIGTKLVGQGIIGGDSGLSAYPYYTELKLKTPKFRIRNFTFIAKGIGYVDFNSTIDFNIMKYENKLPKRFRSKQKLSLDGLTNNN